MIVLKSVELSQLVKIHLVPASQTPQSLPFLDNDDAPGFVTHAVHRSRHNLRHIHVGCHNLPGSLRKRGKNPPRRYISGGNDLPRLALSTRLRQELF
jgi:hypothetical protein